jgi:hypothetical protein
VPGTPDNCCSAAHLPLPSPAHLHRMECTDDAELDARMQDCIARTTQMAEIVRLANQRGQARISPGTRVLRDDAERSNDMTRYGKPYLAPKWYSATGAPPTRCFLRFAHGTRFAHRRPRIDGRESEDVPAMRRRGPHAAPVHTIGPHGLSGRVPGLSVHGVCGRQFSRSVMRRQLSIGTRPKAKEAARSCENSSWL